MADDTTEATDPVEQPAPEAEIDTSYGVPLTSSRGQTVLHPRVDELTATVEALRADEFNVCVDVTAVDYLDEPGRDVPTSVTAERFELVVNLLSHRKRERVRLRVQVPADEPTVPSLFDLFPGTEAPEREVHDLFGIVFDGHPDLSRILMPEDWEGHPLRKDYDTGAIPVQFKAAPGPR
jgi:NADH-quinone oxidoreductase subunit C